MRPCSWFEMILLYRQCFVPITLCQQLTRYQSVTAIMQPWYDVVGVLRIWSHFWLTRTDSAWLFPYGTPKFRETTAYDEISTHTSQRNIMELYKSKLDANRQSRTSLCSSLIYISVHPRHLSLLCCSWLIFFYAIFTVFGCHDCNALVSIHVYAISYECIKWMKTLKSNGSFSLYLRTKPVEKWSSYQYVLPNHLSPVLYSWLKFSK